MNRVKLGWLGNKALTENKLQTYDSQQNVDSSRANLTESLKIMWELYRPLTLFRPGGGSFLPAPEIFFNNSKKNEAIVTKLFDNLEISIRHIL